MSTPLRILHVITGLDVGGAETMLKNLVSSMDRGTFANAVVSLTTKGSIGREIEASGMSVSELRIGRGRPDPRLLSRLRRVILDYQPDIVQTWLYHADLAGALLKRFGVIRRLAWNIRCASSAIDGADTVPRYLYWALAKLSRVPDGVIINSECGREVHRDVGFRPKTWTLIPNGFDTARFAPDAAARRTVREQLNVSDETLLVGLIARADPLKDHELFFRAAGIVSRRHDVAFVLAGDGVDSNNLQFLQWIDTNGLSGRVHLLGQRRDVQRIYTALDIACLTSAGEGFPNAIGEAMSSGVPVVATDAGDTSWILGPDAGLVTPVGDAEQFARALSSMITRSAAERSEIGARGRRRIVESFSLAAIVARYEQFYSSLANHHVD